MMLEITFKDLVLLWAIGFVSYFFFKFLKLVFKYSEKKIEEK